MLKATKLTLAAAFLAGSCGLAMAQGTSGAGGDKSPAGTGAHEKGNPTSGTIKPATPMTQKNTGMPTATKDAGQETGTAKDSAGTGQMREESKKEQQSK
jgi:hypothetical protein